MTQTSNAPAAPNASFAGSSPRVAVHGATVGADAPAGRAGLPRRPLPVLSRSASRAGAGTGPDRPADAEYVIYRLEEAGAALLALPNTGWTTKLRSGSLEIVRSAAEAYGWVESRIRPPVPSAERITRMDEAMGWLQTIPEDRYVLRRIVGARSLVHPITERHLFTWRRLGTAMGADHKAVQRWHAEGIDLIVAALNGRGGGLPAVRPSARR